MARPEHTAQLWVSLTQFPDRGKKAKQSKNMRHDDLSFVITSVLLWLPVQWNWGGFWGLSGGGYTVYTVERKCHCLHTTCHRVYICKWVISIHLRGLKHTHWRLGDWFVTLKNKTRRNPTRTSEAIGRLSAQIATRLLKLLPNSTYTAAKLS